MPRALAPLLLSLLLMPLPARAGDLTLRDLIELHRAGLGEELLIAVIQADGGPFKLSYAEIMDLKTEGLGERVIAALVRTGSRTGSPLVAVASDEAVAVAVAPVVIEPEVSQVEPAVVVVETVVPYPVPYVVTPSRNHRHDDDRRGHHDRREDKTPAATWVTRAEDGRNVTPGGRPIRGDAPRATWVTPNEARSHDSGSRGDGSDKAGRHDDRAGRREDDRKPRP